MKSKGLTLLEIAVIVIVIGILAALLLPPLCGPRNHPRVVACQSNLRQLYVLGTVYARSNKGQWPSKTGEELWFSFANMEPPLIDREALELFVCPVRGENPEHAKTDYRGPSSTWNKLGLGEPLGADKPDNHGEDFGGNVLIKDGSVQELGSDDALWKKCRDLLSP